jgi:hypothetical protein
MGRTAGLPARVAGSDRPSSGRGRARPALSAVGGPKAPAPSRAPLAPRAPATPSSLAPVAPSARSAPPPGNPRAVETKTVREILPPWHVLQEKLQSKTANVVTRNEALNQDAQLALEAQEAANANWAPPPVPRTPSSDYSLEAPPSSGVRMSDPGPASDPSARVVEPSASQRGVPDSLLTFKVYTLAELERRSHAPVSVRASRLNFDMTSSRTSHHWQRVATALRAFATASITWIKITGDRPSLKVALRKPFDNLGDELQVAVESIDWKKLGVTTGIVVGATLTLLFGVLTVAELTDDLKPPGAAAHLASSETSGIPSKSALDARGVAPATNMAAMGVQPVAAASQPPPAPAVIAPPAEAATSIGDIDDPEPAAAAPAKKPAKKAAAAKPKTSKLTLRSAPF